MSDLLRTNEISDFYSLKNALIQNSVVAFHLRLSKKVDHLQNKYYILQAHEGIKKLKNTSPILKMS